MSDSGRHDDHIGAPPRQWSRVELVVDTRGSIDTETIVEEWAHENAGWSVSAVSEEEVVKRGLDSLSSQTLRSRLALRPDFAIEFGRFVTLAADGRAVSVRPNVPPFDLTLGLDGVHGSILFHGGKLTPLAIAVEADSVFCASTIRVAARLIEDEQNDAFAAIIEAAASSARLLDADPPRIVRELKLERSRSRSSGEHGKGLHWIRSLRREPFNGHLGHSGTRQRYLTQLALVETAAEMVSRAYH